MTDISSEIRADIPTGRKPGGMGAGIVRRYREFALISRDPVLFIGLLFCGLFLTLFIFLPLARSISGGFFNQEGQFDLSYFARYFDAYYGPEMRVIFLNTLEMGVLSST